MLFGRTDVLDLTPNWAFAHYITDAVMSGTSCVANVTSSPRTYTAEQIPVYDGITSPASFTINWDGSNPPARVPLPEDFDGYLHGNVGISVSQDCVYDELSGQTICHDRCAVQLAGGSLYMLQGGFRVNLSGSGEVVGGFDVTYRLSVAELLSSELP